MTPTLRDKLEAMADPERNPNANERAVAQAKLDTLPVTTPDEFDVGWPYDDEYFDAIHAAIVEWYWATAK